MEPTLAARKVSPRAHRAATPLAATVWAILIAAAVSALGERAAGTMSEDRSALAVLVVATAAMALSALAAGLFLRAARADDAQLTEERPTDLLWRMPIRPGSVPVALIAVAPPLVLGLSLLPADSTVGVAVLLAEAACAAGLLMTQHRSSQPGQNSNRSAGQKPEKHPHETSPVAILPLPLPVMLATSERRSTDAPTAIPFPATAEAVPSATPKHSPFAVFDPGDDDCVESGRVHEESDEGSEEGSEESNGRTVLHLVRRIDADGHDSMEGQFQVEIPPGRRHANFHIPFSPPFASIPEVSCDVIEGNESTRVKVGLAAPWGIRIEARRPADDDCEILQIAVHVACNESFVAKPRFDTGK